MLKIFHCLPVPLYLGVIFKRLSNDSRYPSRINRDLLFSIKKARNSCGDRCFAVFVARIWNELPDELKLLPHLERFKKNLKTYLF